MSRPRVGIDGFQKLALATTATTYLLILVGGLVRASGAGMGCPDWPKCFGLWIPPLRADQLPPAFDPARFNAALTWTEYTNRLLGVATGFLIFGTLIAAIVYHRRSPRILWPVVAAFLGVGFQGWLGGRVVAHNLAPWVVTVHLLVALVIVSLLLYATAQAFFEAEGPRTERRPVDGVTATGTTALMALSLSQIALGTQVRGAIDQHAATFGLPRSALLASVGWPDTAHRNLALVVLAVALWLAWRVHRSAAPTPLRRAAFTVAGLAAAQVAAGITLAYFALPRPVQVAHLSIASLLLGAETLLALLARRSAEEGGHRL
ncbi:MAG: heme A synthase [Vicinamibacteria bacterium]